MGLMRVPVVRVPSRIAESFFVTGRFYDGVVGRGRVKKSPKP